MKSWRKKTVFLVLLLMPLQALAASLSAFVCYTANAGQPSMSSHQHDDGARMLHDGGPPQLHDDGATSSPEDEAVSGDFGHLNCHQVVTGVLATIVVSAPAELRPFESSLSLLVTLFVPERPQRPPRI